MRLTNPLYLFELGLESTNGYVRTLLWVSALDALLMAGTRGLFVERLSNALGSTTLVLPKVDPGGQPSYRVREFASDLYDLRSDIAHGRTISNKFLVPRPFTNVAGGRIDSYPPNPRYSQILEECALFSLTGVLRRIFLDALVQTFSDTRAWRARLGRPFP